MMEDKMMPVLGRNHHIKKYPNLPTEVPFRFLDEDFAMMEHGQTLSRLAQRGGLSVWELYHHLRKEEMRTYSKVTDEMAIEFLMNFNFTANGNKTPLTAEGETPQILSAHEIMMSNLGFQSGTNDKWWLQFSAKNYLESGKVSGSFHQAVIGSMQEYAAQQTSSLQERVRDIENHNDMLKRDAEDDLIRLDQKDARIAELEQENQTLNRIVDEHADIDSRFAHQVEDIAKAEYELKKANQLNEKLMVELKERFMAEKEGGQQPDESDWQSFLKEHGLNPSHPEVRE